MQVQRKVYIKENSPIAAVAARILRAKRVAIVIHNTIHLHNTEKQSFINNRKWLLHELKHIEQYRRYGTLSFLGKYLWESFKKGYFNNKYEAEARMAVNDESLLTRYDIQNA